MCNEWSRHSPFHDRKHGLLPCLSFLICKMRRWTKWAVLRVQPVSKSPGGLVKTRFAWPYLQNFWFSRLENLSFQHIPRWSWCCWSRDTLGEPMDWVSPSPLLAVTVCDVDWLVVTGVAQAERDCGKPAWKWKSPVTFPELRGKWIRDKP